MLMPRTEPDAPERILKMLHVIVMQAMDLPQSNRRDFIKDEVAAVRRHLLDKYSGNPEAHAAAEKFTERLDEWAMDLLRLTEVGGGSSGCA